MERMKIKEKGICLYSYLLIKDIFIDDKVIGYFICFYG